MPYGSSVNDLPTGLFLAVQIAALALGAGFAGFEGRACPLHLHPARPGPTRTVIVT